MSTMEQDRPILEGSSEFWKDIPDDVLEELYKQLDHGPAPSEQPEILGETLWGQSAGQLPWSLSRSNSDLKDPFGLFRGDSFGSPAAAGQPVPPLFRGGSNLSLPPQTPGLPAVQIRPDPAPHQIQVTSIQWQADNNKAKQILEQIQQLISNQDQQIDSIRQMQQQLIVHGELEGLRQLADQQFKLLQQIEIELKELHHLNKTIVLDHSNLHATRVHAIRLQMQQQRIELLRQELQHHSTPGAPPKLFAGLLILEQPLPQVVFKGKVVEDAYVVQLVTGSHHDIQSTSKVKATLISEEHNWKTMSPLENDTTMMDHFHFSGVFHNVKINVSTRMTPVHLKFTVQAQTQRNGSVTVESTLSYPLIVITNESQWCDAAGKLILADAFAGQLEVSWPQFANSIHHHFLKSTRQDPSRPSRALNESDWNYIHSKFFGNSQVISQQQAMSFWQYFGQVVCTLRFKRHINSLWFVGLIYGFITKEECNAALQNQELGLFMIRFSESYPGLFAIAYVSDDPFERVKHYLVKPEDISSNKTLADFVREKPQFQFCYQLDTPTGTLRKFPRDVVFGPYYSKTRKIQTGNNGYVLL